VTKVSEKTLNLPHHILQMTRVVNQQRKRMSLIVKRGNRWVTDWNEIDGEKQPKQVHVVDSIDNVKYIERNDQL